MSFINVNKVELKETDDVIEAMTDVTLLLSSIIYDCVQKKEYDEAIHQAILLTESAKNLTYLLSKKGNND